MYAVVSLLDDRHYEQVEALWRELEERFGLRGVAEMSPFPHITYLTRAAGNPQTMRALAQSVAAQSTAFAVHSSGLGIFTGESPVIYIPVARSDRLAGLHSAVLEAFDAAPPPQAYHPAQWMPHITLAQRDLEHDELPAVINFLSERSFQWELTIHNLTVLDVVIGTKCDLLFRFDFGVAA